MLATFWLPRVPMYRIAASWCSTNLRGARWICGIRHRAIGAENIPTTPHIVLSKHSSTWETLALTLFFPPLAYVAKKELLSIPVLRLGLRARVAHHHRPQGRHRLDAADRGAGPRALPAGLLDRHLSGRHADPRRVRAPSTRPAARGSPSSSARRSCRSRTTPATCGRRASSASVAGTVTISFGKPISPQGKDVPTLMREVETWIEAEVARLGVPTRDD